MCCLVGKRPQRRKKKGVWLGTEIVELKFGQYRKFGHGFLHTGFPALTG
jgi:hypothetical protein